MAENASIRDAVPADYERKLKNLLERLRIPSQREIKTPYGITFLPYKPKERTSDQALSLATTISLSLEDDDRHIFARRWYEIEDRIEYLVELRTGIEEKIDELIEAVLGKAEIQVHQSATANSHYIPGRDKRLSILNRH